MLMISAGREISKEEGRFSLTPSSTSVAGAFRGCVRDEVVTLYCHHHHHVVCEVVVGQVCVFRCW